MQVTCVVKYSIAGGCGVHCVIARKLQISHDLSYVCLKPTFNINHYGDFSLHFLT